MNKINHPAKYSDVLLPIFADLLEDSKLILDPFGGSGVVMEEALKLQRKVHTIDISENSINNFILPKLDKGLIYEQRTY